jgi:hypothetical protein
MPLVETLYVIWILARVDIAQSGCPYIRGVLDVLYDTYNAFCAILYIFAIFGRGELHRNDLGHTIKSCHWSRWREDPTMILPKVAARISIASWTFCMIPIIHSVQYIFAIFGRGELHRNDLGHTIKPCHWS